MTALPDALTVRIMRWALANGWRQQWAGWTSPDRTTAVHPHRNNVTGLVVIYRRDNATDPWDTYAGGPWRELAVRNVQEAADWLVLCGVLPVQFSSAYAAALADLPRQYAPGWSDGMVITATTYTEAGARRAVEELNRQGHDDPVLLFCRLATPWIQVETSAREVTV